jgi:hypothetical protein
VALLLEPEDVAADAEDNMTKPLYPGPPKKAMRKW